MSGDKEWEDASLVDRHVGMRMRLRRRELGMTQTELAEALGLTFQQVQKYERAANRVSASKLWEAAQALKTSVAYFFEGLGEIAPDTGGEFRVDAILLSPEGLELAEAFPRIRRARVRRKLLELTRSLLDDDE